MDEKIYRELLDAARESCLPAVWSRGVGLARSNTVFIESIEDDEVTLRVQGAMVSPTVTLWPQEPDWWCDCDENSDAVCEHVAASVIVMLQKAKSGATQPTGTGDVAKLRYELYVDDWSGNVSLRRIVFREDRQAVLRGSIEQATVQGIDGMRVVADPIDLQIERIIAGLPNEQIPFGLAEKLLTTLKSSDRLTFRGKPIGIGETAAPFEVVLEDDHGGFKLSLRPNPCIDERFPNQIVRCGETLRPLGDRGIDERTTAELQRGKHITFSATAQLLSHTLPELEKHLPVRILARRLPSVSQKLRPRIVVQTERQQDGMSVLATIVYGDPPQARVDGDRLTQLGKVVPRRRRDLERRLERQLQDDLGLSPGVRVFVAVDEAIAMADKLRKLSRQGITVQGDGPSTFFLAGSLRPVVRGGVDDIEMDFVLEPDDLSAVPRGGGGVEPFAVVHAWERGASLVPLSEGGWAKIPADWFDKYGHRLAALLAAKAASSDGRLPKGAIPTLARLQADLDLPEAPSFSSMRAVLESPERLAAEKLPEDLNAELRIYQREGVRWLQTLQRLGLGALLADDMGLGKTLQALCVIPSGRKSLIVAPTSVLHNWAQEARRFRPGLRVHVYHGPRRRLDPEADLTIATYGVLRLDVEQLSKQTWDVLVLDEAQAIKNPASQAARAAFRLRTRFPIALTGTPVENRLDELWSIMHFTNRGLLGGRTEFDRRVAQPIARGDEQAAAELRERIRLVVLRRLKKDVARELPPRTEVVLRCELSPGEREVYDAVRAATVPGVLQKLQEGSGVMAALEALLRLRQACCHPSLVPGSQWGSGEEPSMGEEPWNSKTSAKLALLMRRLDEARADGHKSLVFSQWTSLLDRVEPLLEEQGIAFLRLDGSTRDRQGVVDRFQQPDGPAVLLISLKAGGTGLNLTQADHVFLLDPWWNPAVEDQAADRVHRIGQTRAVFIHKLIAADTVEERILELQQKKRALAQAAVSAGGSTPSLTKDDLLAMLRYEEETRFE